MNIEQTLAQLREMKLSAMADSLLMHVSNGNTKDLEPQELVSLLVQDEFNARKNRKLSKMIALANFKPEKACLENIHYDPARGFSKKDLLLFTSETWIKEARNIIISGPTGTGKTFVAEAIGLCACKLGHPAYKYRYPILFEEIHAAKGTGQFLKLLKKIAHLSVLILDDFLVQPIDTHDANALLEIIEEKQQTGSIIITSQFPIDKWHAKLPDPTIADAICDRLIHSAYKFKFSGHSMRKEKKEQ